MNYVDLYMFLNKNECKYILVRYILYNLISRIILVVEL